MDLAALREVELREVLLGPKLARGLRLGPCRGSLRLLLLLVIRVGGARSG